MTEADIVLARVGELLAIEPRLQRFSISPEAEAALHSVSWGDLIFMPGTEPPRKIHGRPYCVAALPAGVIIGSMLSGEHV